MYFYVFIVTFIYISTECPQITIIQRIFKLKIAVKTLQMQIAIGDPSPEILPVDAVQPDDVRMLLERLQEHDLPEGPLGVRLVPERVEDLLDRDHLLRLPVDRLPDDPVRALPQPLLDVEPPGYVLVDLRHLILGLRHPQSLVRIG